MIDKTYKYNVKCDICGTTEDYETTDDAFWPDDWFEVRNNGNNVNLLDENGTRTNVSVLPIHLCLDCFERLFGYCGIAYEDEEAEEGNTND